MPRHEQPAPAAPERIPPQSMESEQAVLGSMLLERDAIAQAASLLTAEDFYREAHQGLFAAMVDLFNAGVAVDLVTLGERLRDRGKIEQAGGVAYLTELLEAVPTSANVERYAAVVAAKARQRALISAGQEILSQSTEYGGDDVTGLAAWATTTLLGIQSEMRQKAATQTAGQLAEAVYAECDRRMAGAPGELVVPTGIGRLDRQLGGGMRAGELVVLAGREKQGKTSVAVNWVLHAAREGHPAIFISVEMTGAAIGQKLLSLVSGVPTMRIRSGYLNDSDRADLYRAARELGRLPLHVIDQGSMSVDELGARARLERSRIGAELIVVDYAQKLDCPGERERHLQVAQITIALKTLARDLKIPVLALSQLRRLPPGVSRKPELDDFAESARLARECDSAVLIWREKDEPDAPRGTGQLNLILAANRMGPEDMIPCGWDGPTQQIWE